MEPKFPSKYHVENFSYNGFIVKPRKGFAKWTISSFVKWTDDSGIGLFKCSDGKQRSIPSCQLSEEYYKELPPYISDSKKALIIFGTPSTSR